MTPDPRDLASAPGPSAGLPKLETGIPGFDHVSVGGLPRRRATVVAGQAGSAKTVFAAQFLAEGVRRGQPGVFVTLEEPASDLRTNLATVDIDVEPWERSGDWRFVDASPLVRVDSNVAPYSMEVLTAQIGHAVDATGADRLVLDSLNAVLALHDDPALARQQLRSLIHDLRAMGLTVLMTVETPTDPSGALSRYGIEEFVADTVLLLRNRLDGAFRRRTVEVLKMRGAAHLKGEVPFTVLPGRGVVVMPVLEPAQSPNVFDQRIPTGNDGLDELTVAGGSATPRSWCPGRPGQARPSWRPSSPAAGSGRRSACCSSATRETREQVHRNARGWGHDLTAARDRGGPRGRRAVPRAASLDDHLVRLKEMIEGRPSRPHRRGQPVGAGARGQRRGPSAPSSSA
jgi:circadian clock protein KaiC